MTSRVAAFFQLKRYGTNFRRAQIKLRSRFRFKNLPDLNLDLNLLYPITLSCAP